MPRWKEILGRYAHIIWWGVCALLALACIGFMAGVWVSGSRETRDAFDSGRRLIITIDTGEIHGKVLTLDAPPPPKPAAPDAAAPPAGPDKPDAAAPAPDGHTATEPASEPARKTAETPRTPTADTNPALVEHTDAGNLPIIGSDGAKPWRYYSKPFERKRNQPMVAIIITGLGTGRAVTKQALDLPENVTLSFSPYARDIATWSASARGTGHEMLIDLPLQPSNYPASDPGPQALLLEKGVAGNDPRLKWSMAKFPAYMGFLTWQNEAFTSNEDAMKFLLQSLANRGLMMVLSEEPHKKEIKDMIDAGNGVVLIADTLIDEELSESAIQTRLAQLEDKANKQGYAIGIAQAYPLTVQQLQAWSDKLAERGILLVPVSAVAKLRFS